ncbi:MAG: ABC transporter permease [Nitrososphaerales archaeon]
MHQVLRLVHRNLTATIDKPFLIWQILFPLIYIFIAGYAYTSIIEYVNVGDVMIDYPAFLASGMIGFNVMNSSLIAGTIIWSDRRNGMFEQILVGPFTRAHYIASNILTITMLGLASAGIIVLASTFTVFSDAPIFLPTVPYVVLAMILGSILFGSIAIIVSIKMRSTESFQITINTTFLFFAFVSTTFYPMQGAPEALGTAFLVNPLTYVVDIIRFGLFASGSPLLIYEGITLALASTVMFFVATFMLAKLNI